MLVTLGMMGGIALLFAFGRGTPSTPAFAPDAGAKPPANLKGAPPPMFTNALPAPQSR